MKYPVPDSLCQYTLIPPCDRVQILSGALGWRRYCLVCFSLLAFSWLAVKNCHGWRHGLLTIHPPLLPEGFENPVSATYEQGFRQRYNALLESWTKGREGFKKVDNRRYFESEKWSYPNAMLHILAGNVAPGVAVLQAEDQPQNPADNEYTKGIDLWSGFTLKGQARKYFQFRHLLDESYRQRMADAIATWTTTHPRHTPHRCTKFSMNRSKAWGLIVMVIAHR